MSINMRTEIVLLSSGHMAMDHRVFDKEAMTLARQFPRVRVVAAHPVSEMRELVQITALPMIRSRIKRFLLRPLQCFLEVRGTGDHIVILHDAELLLWVPLVKLFTRWRVIYDVHEDFSQLLLRRNWIPARLRRLLGRIINTLEKVLAKRCDGIMGATAVLADYFSPLPRIALYNLPSKDFIDTASRSSRPVLEREYDIVHLGTLSTERMEFLCEVFEKILSRKPSLSAMVIGVEPEQQEYILKRFPNSRINVVRKVTYDKIAGHLGNCRIGIDVHPVLYPHLRCAVPVKVFEYMAAGCNVVTSFLPELHRLLGEEGEEHVMTIYTPSQEAFANEVVRLLDEPTFMEEHHAALMRLVNSRFNWEFEAEKLIQFVSQILPAKERMEYEKILNH